MKLLAKIIFNVLFRWKLVGSFPTAVKKYVIILVPHTSWIDFPIALSVKYMTEINVCFVGKASLFKKPFGWFFRYFGGIPIDRSKSNNSVEFIVSKFNENENFIFSLSPEGTRKKVETWKTGFYYVAKLAKVPIVKVALDYKNKEVRIDTPFYTTDDVEADFIHLKSYFNGVVGKHPHLS